MNDKQILIISSAILIFSTIVATVVYYTNDRNLMAKNIENAIAKGIDPISVRCSYAKSDDIICISYGISHPSTLNTNTTNNKR